MYCLQPDTQSHCLCIINVYSLAVTYDIYGPLRINLRVIIKDQNADVKLIFLNLQAWLQEIAEAFLKVCSCLLLKVSLNVLKADCLHFTNIIPVICVKEIA